MKKFNKKELEQARYIVDDHADQMMAQLIEQSNPADIHLLMQWLNGSLESCPSQTESTLKSFFNAVEIPQWADIVKIKEGSKFYKKHEKVVLFLLGTLSLPYCYAAQKGVQVLYLSQRLRNDTYKRLKETGEFVVKVCQFDEKNINNWKNNILKIRMLHSIARNFVSKNQSWNTEWGLPINQEDMAGTNLSFSYVVLRGMRKLGIKFTQNEAESFLHLWNVIGALLGVDEKFLPNTMQEAYWLDKMIVEKEFKPSYEGKELTKALINVYKDQNSINWISSYLIDQMRFLLGRNIADMLDLPASKVSNSTSLQISFTLFSNIFLTGNRSK
jgi:glutaredoxin-related protein